MTQALLNKLNNMIDTTYVKSDVQHDADELSIDFGEILNQKTAGTKQTKVDEKQTTVDKKQTAESAKQMPEKVNISANANKNIVNNTKNTANNAAKRTTESTENIDDEIITTISKTKVQDEDVEMASETVIAAENSLINALILETETNAKTEIEADVDTESEVVVNTEEETEVETEETDTITDETDIKEENTVISEEITITNEDPTMYKEQITLENSNVVLLAQAQIITKKQNVQTDDETVASLNRDNQTVQFKNTGKDSLSNEQTKSLLAQSGVKLNEIPVKDSSAIKTDLAKQVKDIISEENIRDLNIETIESGSAENSTTSEDLMQNQTPQEQAAKVMIRGDVKSDSIKMVQQTDVLKYSSKPSDITPSRIVEQITKQLEGMYSNSKVNIVLNPEHLGRVALNIMNTKDGLLAQFTVTTQEARDLLTRGLNGLRDGLLAHGVSVDNVTIKLSETGDSEHQSDLTEQDGSRGGYKGQGFRRQKENQKEFEQMMFELSENGNV